MFAKSKSLSSLLLLVAGLAGATYAAAESGDIPAVVETGPQGSSFRCEIEVREQGGMVSLSGVVEAEVAIAGSYRFRVESAGGSGNASISQGGGFSAGPGEAVTLGRVMLSANGVYDASLDLDTDAGSVDCEERAGRI